MCPAQERIRYVFIMSLVILHINRREKERRLHVLEIDGSSPNNLKFS